MAQAPTKDSDSPHTDSELVIRVVAMPAQTNANGDIFGGWILSQMDIGGGILARKVAQKRVVTVAIEAMSFISPVQVGDVVSCYAHIERVGRTSLTVAMEIWAYRHQMDQNCCVTKGTFTYVAIDDQGRPTPIKTDEKPSKSCS